VAPAQDPGELLLFYGMFHSTNRLTFSRHAHYSQPHG
jgi:hypothetical protein